MASTTKRFSAFVGRTFATLLSRTSATTSSRFSGAKAFGLGAIGMTVACPAVALCRPLDTPEYLIPYYLRDALSRFNYYASIKKKGRRYMTAEDFVCALLGQSDKSLADPKAADDLKALFNAVDANGDGKLSFGEFSLLMVLLSTPIDDFRLAFKMMDEDGKGSLTRAQFAVMLNAFGDDSVKPSIKGGLVTKLFGPDMNQRCSIVQLEKLIDDLHLEVTKAEFRQFDKKRRGAITSDQFGRLIASHLVGSHLPFFMVENLRSMKVDGEVVPFSTYQSFSTIMRNADLIAEAIRIYTKSGKPLRKVDLRNAVRAVGLPPLSKGEVDLVYALFDKDGDGNLEYDEFIGVMQNKVSFHAKQSAAKDPRNVFAQFAHCASEAVFSS